MPGENLPLNSVEPAPPRRFHDLDLLRLVAALAVILYHYTFRVEGPGALAIPRFPSALTSISRYGVFGVEVFFFISGFVIVRSIRRHDARGFARSRVVRLYPGYWASLTFTYIVILLYGASDTFDVTPAVFAVNLTMLQRLTPWTAIDVDGAYWTLAVEMVFYFFVFILIATKMQARLTQALTIWLALAALAELQPTWLMRTFALSEWAPFFIAGACCCLIERGDRRPSHWILLAVAALQSVRRAAAHAAAMSAFYSEEFSAVVAGIVVSVGLLLVLAVALGWTKALGRPWMSTAAAISYPMYLLHQNVGYLLLQRFAHVNRYALLVGVTTFIALVAWAVTRWVEPPAQRAMRGLMLRAPAPSARLKDV